RHSRLGGAARPWLVGLFGRSAIAPVCALWRDLRRTAGGAGPTDARGLQPRRARERVETAGRVTMLRPAADGPSVIVCSTCRHGEDAREDDEGVRGGARLAGLLRGLARSESVYARIAVE